ncbi:NADPH:quinone oxidoreductase family protein [Sinimarinibacterium flocculans]|uniref:NADPH:quinone reductase-like Zn-dependent oxidoreductase n=1 Tax=Sinimarinibacterium flocculans TaxID=985250 RepID=A0A318E2Q6_9GAMM|nr:NADPH:quinone oxidoreductase family protein [Sinimarinibacterium flocculans]PXV65301.1 NADPH:quinone reductase-like Zn-dependent oxidoreductase [Sinimarinibacterium flocculans]
MKALLCKSFGPPENLVVEEAPDLTPGDNDAIVRVHAAGVNFPDVLIIQNKYQFKPELPFSAGGECSGVVESVGAKVKNVKPGDKVIAFTGWGAFAHQVRADSRALIPMPPEMDFVTGASFVMTYATSYHALKDRAALKSGEILLVLGASGGVGLAAIEIGKALGARVIAAASTAEKLAVCKDHGADELINYNSEDLKARLKELTGGKGVDVVYDPVGGDYSEPALRSMAWRGRFLVIGFANGEIPKIPLNLALLKGCSIVGVFWGDYAKREPMNNLMDLRALLGWLKDGKLRPHIAGTYPLERGAEAIRQLMDRKVSGKLVITPQE